MNWALFSSLQVFIACSFMATASDAVFVKAKRRPFEQQLRAQSPGGQPRALLNHHNDRQKLPADRNGNLNANSNGNNVDLANAEDPGTLAAEDLSPGLGLPFNSFNNKTVITKNENSVASTAATTNSNNSTVLEDFSNTPLFLSGANVNNIAQRPVPAEPLNVLRAELIRVDEQIQQQRTRDNSVGKMFQILKLLDKREELQDKIAIKMQADSAGLAENA